MENMTVWTTWSDATGMQWEDAYDLDPHGVVVMDMYCRIGLDAAAENSLMSHMEEMLSKYGGYMLGNGDIVGPVGGKPDREDIRARYAEWNPGDLLERYISVLHDTH